MVRRGLIVAVIGAALLAAALVVIETRPRPAPHALRAAAKLPGWARQLLARAPLLPPRSAPGGVAVRPRGADPYRAIHGYTCFVVPGAHAPASPCGRPAHARFILG